MLMIRNVLIFFLLSSSISAYAANQWSLVWSDEFNGATGLPNATDWRFDTCPCYNGEKQNYTVNTTNNARVDGAGNLVIEVKKELSNGKPFSSARLISNKAWTYGRMEVRAKLPDGKFLWPAIWMLPQVDKYGTWPRSGEIDIMENWNRGWDQNAIFGTLHTQPFSGGGAKQGRTELNSPSLPSDDFHVYSVEWYKDQIRFFVDGNVYYTYYNEQLDFNPAFPFDNPFNFILNIAVEQDATGSEAWVKRTMEVDYVRVYQGPTQGPAINYIPVSGTIEAENFFDQYKVLNQNNSSGVHVAFIDANDWMDYKVNVNQSGAYKSSYRVAGTSSGQLQLISGSTVLETVNIPNTGGYDAWQTVQTGNSFNLPAGQQTLRVKVVYGSFNFDKFDVILNGSASSSQGSSTILVSNGRDTFASSQLQLAGNAVDGNAATRWESAFAADPSWLTVDLGSSYNLSQVVIDWEAANADSYSIQGSNDNTAWTTLKTVTGGIFGTRTDTNTISGNYRYLRIYCTSRSSGNQWGYSIWELKIYAIKDVVSSAASSVTSLASSSVRLSSTASLSSAASSKKSSSSLSSSVSSSSAATGGITSALKIYSDWGAGYCANVIVNNNGSSVVAWKAVFQADGVVASIWNGAYTKVGGLLTISGVGWNNTIAPGQTLSSTGICINR